jgi:hypothetical protein
LVNAQQQQPPPEGKSISPLTTLSGERIQRFFLDIITKQQIEMNIPFRVDWNNDLVSFIHMDTPSDGDDPENKKDVLKNSISQCVVKRNRLVTEWISSIESSPTSFILLDLIYRASLEARIYPETYVSKSDSRVKAYFQARQHGFLTYKLYHLLTTMM